MGFSPGEKHYTTTSIFSNIIDAATGSFTEGLTVSGTPIPLEAGAASEYIHIREEKAQPSAGGTFTQGAWRTRVLNTIVTDDTGVVTLVANQFTLPAGTYKIYATLPAYAVNWHDGQLQNITDGTMTLQSIPAFAHSTLGGFSSGIICGTFTLSASKTFEFQHWCSATRADSGFGTADCSQTCGAPHVNIYTNMELWKLS